MPLADQIQYLEDSTEGPYYYILLDLREAFDPDHKKFGRATFPYSNHEVQDEVLARLAADYGPETVIDRDRAPAFRLIDPLSHEEFGRVDFDSEMAAFGVRAADRDALVTVCNVVDVLAAEAQGEPSFAALYGMRYEDVPPEYKKLMNRAVRLARLRSQGELAEYVIGHEKRLLREAAEQVRDLDGIEEREAL